MFFTLNDMLQLPLAGMLASASVTLPVALVSVSLAPPQVLAGDGEVSVRPAGSDSVTPD